MSEILLVEITDAPENEPLQALDWPAPLDALLVCDGFRVVTENNGVAVLVTDTDPDSGVLVQVDKPMGVFVEVL
jgi:hypothetical protein